MVLPKSMRISGHKCFDYLYKEANRFQGQFMLLRVAKAKKNLLRQKNEAIDKDKTRCAISISNKVSKKAVVRNRLRRLFHHHLKFRLYESSSAKSNWAFITLKPNSIKEESSTLLKECDKLLLKAGLF